mmetsp:Transcript_6370/g.13896  ORF Transcript_6370/g.13896 Transcript_6370/m.13896 type:complete len:327 (+) Transcript_6370:631-1611(+)
MLKRIECACAHSPPSFRLAGEKGTRHVRVFTTSRSSNAVQQSAGEWEKVSASDRIFRISTMSYTCISLFKSFRATTLQPPPPPKKRTPSRPLPRAHLLAHDVGAFGERLWQRPFQVSRRVEQRRGRRRRAALEAAKTRVTEAAHAIDGLCASALAADVDRRRRVQREERCRRRAGVARRLVRLRVRHDGVAARVVAALHAAFLRLGVLRTLDLLILLLVGVDGALIRRLRFGTFALVGGARVALDRFDVLGARLFVRRAECMLRHRRRLDHRLGDGDVLVHVGRRRVCGLRLVGSCHERLGESWRVGRCESWRERWRKGRREGRCR